MAEKIFNTRIALKLDTLENWKVSTLVLKKGEVALATTAAEAGIGLTEPVIMIKVGDGDHTFSQLGWNLYAKASDVLTACKTEAGLKAFINGVIGEAGLATGAELETLTGRVGANEAAITTLNGDVTKAGSVAKAIKDAIDALDLANTYAAKSHIHTKSEITDFAHTHVISDVTGLSDAIADAKKAGTDANTALGTYQIANDARVKAVEDDIAGIKDEADGILAQAKAYADGKDTAIAAAKKAGDDAQSTIDSYKTSNDAALAAVKATADAAAVKTEVTAELAKKVDKVDGKSLVSDTEIARLATLKNYDDTAIKADIAKKADSTTMTTELGKKVDKVEGKSLISDAEIARLAGVDNYDDAEVRGLISDNADAIAAINNSETGILKQAKSYADSKDAAIAAAKKAGDDAQADVDALAEKVGTVPADKTVVQMIADAQAAATYDDSALAGRVTTVEGKVNTLVGSDTNKSARTIASEEVAKIVAGADTAYDTLKEISDWISNHKEDATAMNSAITALEGIVDGIGGEGESATVVAYVQAAIDALKIGDYAKAADLTALAGRVTTLEGKAHTHDNKAVLDGITSEKVSAWDTAEQNAKDYADGLAVNYDAAGAAKEVDDKLTAYKAANDAEVAKKANDADLKAVAKSGLIDDLSIGEGTVLVFDCGDADVTV